MGIDASSRRTEMGDLILRDSLEGNDILARIPLRAIISIHPNGPLYPFVEDGETHLNLPVLDDEVAEVHRAGYRDLRVKPEFWEALTQREADCSLIVEVRDRGTELPPLPARPPAEDK
jgi:hypothetical protein